MDISNRDTIFNSSSSSSNRFVHSTQESIEKDMQNRIPLNTQKKCAWAVRLLRLWHDDWKCRLDGEMKVLKPVEEWSSGDLSYALRFFVTEVRKENGDRYPPQTLKELVAAIQHYFQNKLKIMVSIFKDKEFAETRAVIDAQMKISAAEGLVKIKKRAVCLTRKYECTNLNE
jgi:hypothetical protein